MAQDSANSLETGSHAQVGKRLLGIVRGLILELHPHREGTLRVALDSTFDRDLGLDSLGRAELLVRLERDFNRRLSQDLLGSAETVRDLLTALVEPGEAEALQESHIDLPALEPVHDIPAQAATLIEALDWHVEKHPERPHIVLWDEVDSPTISYRDLAERARAVSFGLLQHRVEPGDRVAIMLPTGADFFRTFFGILYAGAVPVPIYPPVRPAQIEDHLRRQAAILSNAGVVGLITVREARRLASWLKSRVESLRFVETPGKLAGIPEQASTPGTLLRVHRGAQDLALLQYTSGSTGSPKGVMLTHQNLLANIRAIGRATKADSSDVLVSWLPLYHDMGLIGAWLATLYHAIPVVIMSPLTFLARPAQWLWAIHRHHATISAAPNFAYELCVGKIDDSEIENLDLGSLRIAMNGAEPVNPRTIERFTQRFAKYGFRPEAMSPVYGMAENGLGVAFPSVDRPPVVDRIQRASMSGRGEAVPAYRDDSNALQFVSCGQPLGGHEVRIVDPAGRELPERAEGRLQFRGPSATQGYFRNEAATRELFDGNWLNSGDLGYIASGDVFVTGRSKDIIIRAGRNIYPHEVEEACGNVDGVRKGCVAVFGVADAASGTERIVIVAETREAETRETAGQTREAVGGTRKTAESRLNEIRRGVEEVAGRVIEAAPDEVVLVPPQTVLKTSSGKIRRSDTRLLYETGKLHAGKRAVWWQLVRLAADSMRARIRQSSRRALDAAYGGYCWLMIPILLTACFPVLLVLPRSNWRWGAAHGTARLALWLAGIPLDIEGLDRLPLSGGVLVVNHASYIDGVALTAAFPEEMLFVAKKELASNWFGRTLLNRVGVLFVERIDPGASVDASREALEAVSGRKRLLFFPEGTFLRMPGLRDFRLGAFLIAARAGVSVSPVTLNGTRSVLRDGNWLPRRAHLRVEIGEPLLPDGDDFQAAIRLRDAARAEIISRCGEPDLAGDRVVFSEGGVERLEG